MGFLHVLQEPWANCNAKNSKLTSVFVQRSGALTVFKEKADKEKKIYLMKNQCFLIFNNTCFWFFCFIIWHICITHSISCSIWIYLSQNLAHSHRIVPVEQQKARGHLCDKECQISFWNRKKKMLSAVCKMILWK